MQMDITLLLSEPVVPLVTLFDSMKTEAKICEKCQKIKGKISVFCYSFTVSSFSASAIAHMVGCLSVAVAAKYNGVILEHI